MISEIYQLSTNKHTNGIQGYYVAKTINYSSRESAFPSSKRKDLSYESKVHENDPDPTKYSETLEKSTQRYWLKPNGKFLRAKKKSIMEEIANQSRATPGPGAYSQTCKKPSTANCSFSKGERLSYLSSVEYYAEETPSSWNYTPSPAKSSQKKGWTRPGKPKPSEKNVIGPGKYTDGLDKGYKQIISSPVCHAFSKSKDTNGSIYQRAKDTSYVPGVGTYVDSEKAYSNNLIFKKPRTALILPYKSKGFTDDIVKRSKETPGPGAYYIGPPIKKKN